MASIIPTDADYERLTAAEVLAALPQLGADDLTRVEARERSGKNRKTVLRRIAKLQASAMLQSKDGSNSDANGAVRLGDVTAEAVPLSTPPRRTNRSPTALDTPSLVVPTTAVASSGMAGTAAAAGPSPLFCGGCGSAVAGSRFCSTCGQPVPATTEAQGEIAVGAVDGIAQRRGTLSKVTMVVLIALIVAAVGFTAWKVIGGQKATHTITGTTALLDAGEFPSSDGRSCAGSGGYSDIRAGASIQVKDEAGALVGSGNLGLGRSSVGGNVCSFDFTIRDVRKADFYTIEVSHRGELSYSRSDLESRGWSVSATLGDQSALIPTPTTTSTRPPTTVFVRTCSVSIMPYSTDGTPAYLYVTTSDSAKIRFTAVARSTTAGTQRLSGITDNEQNPTYRQSVMSSQGTTIEVSLGDGTTCSSKEPPGR